MISTLAEILGALLVAVGCFILAPWLGLIVGGLLLMMFSWLAAR